MYAVFPHKNVFYIKLKEIKSNIVTDNFNFLKGVGMNNAVYTHF